MLQLILGRGGSGKTTALYERLQACVQRGTRAILLVPEQFSFESEKELYRLLGPQLAASVEVLSFTRLCNSIFRTYGGLAALPLTESARQMLMSVALEEGADRLHYYRTQGSSVAFVRQLVQGVDELKAAGISPAALLQFAKGKKEETLGEKAEELGLLYQIYQTLLEQGYEDPKDEIMRALERLEPDFFAGVEVFVDSFVAFMAGEYQMLGRILEGASQVYVALCCDGLVDTEEGLGVFSTAKDTAARLIALAKKQACPVATPVVLWESKRFSATGIARLEEGFLRGEPPMQEGSDGVLLLTPRDPYEEMSLVAADIATKVRQKGWQYRDFVIICRSLEDYRIPAGRSLGRFAIPYFMDTRRSAENTPVLSLALAALDVLRAGFETEHLLRFGKSICLPFGEERMGELENYSYVWGITGRSWLAPFTGNPGGLKEDTTPAEEALLKQVNQTREALLAPLLQLQKRVKEGTPKAFASGLYELLDRVNWGEALQKAAALEMDSKAFLEEQEQVWEQLMQLLDLFAALLPDRIYPLSRLTELLRLGVSAIQIGQIPQTLDQVLVGMADRIRPQDPKCVYLVGAWEGGFPAVVGSGGMFTEAERQTLLESGLEMSPSAPKRAVREKYYAYSAVAAPSHRLWISCPKATLQGELLTPSVLLREARRLLDLPVHTAAHFPVGFGAFNRDTALDALAAVQENTPAYVTLHAFVEQQGGGALLHSIEQRLPPWEYAVSPAVAGNLFGNQMRLSPSRVERYYSCPFAYFCASGLRLRPRQKVEWSPLESGTVIHMVLQQMVSRHGGRGLAALEKTPMRREITTLLDEYLAGKIADKTQLPARFRTLYSRLVSLLIQLLTQLGEEFSQCEFEPMAFELEIGKGKAVPPLELQTLTGATVWVEGTVDRVDTLQKNGKQYVRVIDYKSGRKTFRLSDVGQGLNMQMLLYLFTIWQGGETAFGTNTPAGVLYMPAKGGYLSSRRDADPTEEAAVVQKGYRMSGLLLEDTDVLQGMEKNLSGVFIPAKRKADGSWDSTSSLATLAQLGKLRGKIEEKITQMAQSLQAGEVPALPIEGGEYAPCAYCDFVTVCARGQNDPTKLLEKQKPEEFLNSLEEGEAHACALDQ